MLYSIQTEVSFAITFEQAGNKIACHLYKNPVGIDVSKVQMILNSMDILSLSTHFRVPGLF